MICDKTGGDCPGPRGAEPGSRWNHICCIEIVPPARSHTGAHLCENCRRPFR